MGGKLQKEFFTQKTLFCMLYLQYLKDLKESKKKPFDTKMTSITSIKTNISSNLFAQFSFDRQCQENVTLSQFYKMCAKPMLYRNVISSPSTNCFLLAYDIFQMQLVEGEATVSLSQEL